jgi:hypothetical protein
MIDLQDRATGEPLVRPIKTSRKAILKGKREE